MACFYEVTAVARMSNGEAVVNGWAFREALHSDAAPTYDECLTVVQLFEDLWDDTLIAASVDQCQWYKFACRGFSGTGVPTSFPQVEIEVTPYGGSAGNERDGNLHTAVIKKVLGEGALLQPAGRIPKRGHWAVGPINNSSVDRDGFIVPAGDMWTGLQAWAGNADTNLLLVGGETIQPVVVSHTATNLLLPEGIEVSENITGWAGIIAGSVRARGSIRKSRNNGR